jgi:hypothetical protein
MGSRAQRCASSHQGVEHLAVGRTMHWRRGAAAAASGCTWRIARASNVTDATAATTQSCNNCRVTCSRCSGAAAADTADSRAAAAAAAVAAAAVLTEGCSRAASVTGPTADQPASASKKLTLMLPVTDACDSKQGQPRKRASDTHSERRTDGVCWRKLQHEEVRIALQHVHSTRTEC